MSERKCKTCRFWDGVADADINIEYKQCRRFPPFIDWSKYPQHDYDPTGKRGCPSPGWPKATFPITPSGSWCGEYQPKKG